MNTKDKLARRVVYISGPMSGLPNYNYGAFAKAAKAWREAKYTVINPAENFGGNQELDRTAYLKQDYMTLIQSCNAIALLPGWDKSEGAKCEVMIAKSLGFAFYDAERVGIPFVFDFIIPPLPFTKEFASKLSGDEYNLENAFKDLTPTKNDKKSICQIADKLVDGDRRGMYGHPKDDFDRIAAMASAAGFRFMDPNSNLPRNLKASDHPIYMQFVKISRELNSHVRDNAIDGAGYWKTLDLIYEKEQESEIQQKTTGKEATGNIGAHICRPQV